MLTNGAPQPCNVYYARNTDTTGPFSLITHGGTLAIEAGVTIKTTGDMFLSATITCGAGAILDANKIYVSAGSVGCTFTSATTTEVAGVTTDCSPAPNPGTDPELAAWCTAEGL